MRALGAGFGLLALLVTIAIMVWLWSVHTSVVASKGQEAREKAQQIAGYDESGIPAKDTVKLDPFVVNGKLKYVLVDSIMAGGAFEKYYGLKQNDQIVATGSMDFRNEEAEMAVELIHRAYQTKDKLVVMRSGQKLILPAAGIPDDAAPASPSSAAPAEKSGDAIQRQLDAIPGIR
jgi:hypothetical protein